MNLQTRLNSFFLLKDRLLDLNNDALIQAKASAAQMMRDLRMV